MRTLIALSFGLALAPAAANADSMQDCFNDLNANAYARAVASCTQAIKAQPKNPFWYNNRCKAYRYTGDYERALGDCTTSIELNNPALNVPLTNRGDVYLAKGDFDRAAAEPGSGYSQKPRLGSRGEDFPLVKRLPALPAEKL
jgi:tetratricopeptide (TPR) repeat protein